jgi:hypothetical protein
MVLRKMRQSSFDAAPQTPRLASLYGDSPAEHGANSVLLGTARMGKASRMPVKMGALGTDYGVAKSRCDDLLNVHFDAWRSRDEAPSFPEHAPVGSFDWMVSVYKSSPKFQGRGAKTRRDYYASLNLISRHVLKDGRTFATLMLKSITPGAADRLFD